jgi:putative ABC transport system permease protein
MQGLERLIEPAIYVPFEQETPRRFSLVIRTNTDPAALAPAVRAEILKVDPDQAVADVRPMTDVVADALLIRRLSVWLLGSFASLALGLASVGIYGLTAYSMSRRVREIGLRMALGASGQEVVRLLVWRGLAASIAGVALGLPAAFALAHLMRGLLFGVAAHDTATFIVVPFTLVAVAALASYLPARRATRIDPIVALRYE